MVYFGKKKEKVLKNRKKDKIILVIIAILFLGFLISKIDFKRESENTLTVASKDFTEQKLYEIKYGLESLYLTLTKIIVIYLISILLKTSKELSLVFLFYGILRLTGFGLHAKNTKECWIISLLILVPFPYLLKVVLIPKYINIILSVIGTILLLIYSPADTKKRPLIHKKKRIMYKIITALIASIYTIINVFIKV